MTDHWSKRYARDVARQLNVSISALAKIADVSSTTLTRALNNPNHKHNLGRETLDKIAAKTGISYAPFRDAAGEGAPKISPEEFQQQLEGLPLHRRQKVLDYLADQQRLHAQELLEQASDDQQAAK